uniref:Uncharacterized protein n=1 Tax=Arundo donax TaxID=35708 RepID=A0A0A9E907_ARUDO
MIKLPVTQIKLQTKVYYVPNLSSYRSVSRKADFCWYRVPASE